MSKTILSAEKILPLSSPLLEDYAMILEGDSIIGLETIHSAEKKNPNAKIMNLENSILMPGLINLHTHLELSSLRENFPEGIDFFEWLAELIKIKKKLTKKDYENGVIMGIKEMIRTGTTSVGDITSEGISPNILICSNIRGKVFYEVVGPSELLAGCIWIKKRHEFKKLKNNDLIDAGISPHSCYSLSSGLLKRINKYSSKHAIALSSHISETKDEGEFIRDGKGKFREFLNGLGFKTLLPFHAASSLEYFKDNGLLNKDFLAVHAVWVDESDIKIMKESSVSVAHCPRSNTFLNVGNSPVLKLLKERINVGLGTDSLASNYSLNMWDEMRMAYKLHGSDGLTPYEIFKMATLNGAKALGLEDKIGSLEIGKKADIIAVKKPSISGDNIYLDLLKNTNEVLLTMVSGKVIYSEKKDWN